LKIVVIDGQGGKIGKTLIEKMKAAALPCEIYAIGTNSIATSVMIKAGADYAATGENSVVVNVRDADVIVGPVGIAIADSLLGEVTSRMAAAVGQSPAKKLLLPINKCNHKIIGVKDVTISELIDEAVRQIVNR